MTRFFTGSRLVGFDPPKLGPDRWDCPALWVGLIRWDLLPLNWSQVGGTEQPSTPDARRSWSRCSGRSSRVAGLGSSCCAAWRRFGASGLSSVQDTTCASSGRRLRPARRGPGMHSVEGKNVKGGGLAPHSRAFLRPYAWPSRFSTLLGRAPRPCTSHTAAVPLIPMGTF